MHHLGLARIIQLSFRQKFQSKSGSGNPCIHGNVWICNNYLGSAISTDHVSARLRGEDIVTWEEAAASEAKYV